MQKHPVPPRDEDPTRKTWTTAVISVILSKDQHPLMRIQEVDHSEAHLGLWILENNRREEEPSFAPQMVLLNNAQKTGPTVEFVKGWPWELGSTSCPKQQQSEHQESYSSPLSGRSSTLPLVPAGSWCQTQWMTLGKLPPAHLPLVHAGVCQEVLHEPWLPDRETFHLRDGLRPHGQVPWWWRPQSRAEVGSRWQNQWPEHTNAQETTWAKSLVTIAGLAKHLLKHHQKWTKPSPGPSQFAGWMTVTSLKAATGSPGSRRPAPKSWSPVQPWDFVMPLRARHVLLVGANEVQLEKTLCEVSSSTGNASARCTSNRRRLSNGLTCHSDLSRDGANADSTVTGDLVVSGLVSAFTCITIVLRPTVSSFPSLSAVRVKLTFRTSRFEAVAFSGTWSSSKLKKPIPKSLAEGDPGLEGSTTFKNAETFSFSFFTLASTERRSVPFANTGRSVGSETSVRRFSAWPSNCTSKKYAKALANSHSPTATSSTQLLDVGALSVSFCRRNSSMALRLSSSCCSRTSFSLRRSSTVGSAMPSAGASWPPSPSPPSPPDKPGFGSAVVSSPGSASVIRHTEQCHGHQGH